MDPVEWDQIMNGLHEWAYPSVPGNPYVQPVLQPLYDPAIHPDDYPRRYPRHEIEFATEAERHAYLDTLPHLIIRTSRLNRGPDGRPQSFWEAN